MKKGFKTLVAAFALMQALASCQKDVLDDVKPATPSGTDTTTNVTPVTPPSGPVDSTIVSSATTPQAQFDEMTAFLHQNSDTSYYQVGNSLGSVVDSVMINGQKLGGVMKNTVNTAVGYYLTTDKWDGVTSDDPNGRMYYFGKRYDCGLVLQIHSVGTVSITNNKDHLTKIWNNAVMQVDAVAANNTLPASETVNSIKIYTSPTH